MATTWCIGGDEKNNIGVIVAVSDNGSNESGFDATGMSGDGDNCSVLALTQELRKSFPSLSASTVEMLAECEPPSRSMRGIRPWNLEGLGPRAINLRLEWRRYIQLYRSHVKALLSPPSIDGLEEKIKPFQAHHHLQLGDSCATAADV